MNWDGSRTGADSPTAAGTDNADSRWATSETTEEGRASALPAPRDESALHVDLFTTQGRHAADEGRTDSFAGELFGSQCALGFDGSAIYVAVKCRSAGATGRSETYYARVQSNEGAPSLDAVPAAVTQAAADVDLTIAAADRQQESDLGALFERLREGVPPSPEDDQSPYTAVIADESAARFWVDSYDQALNVVAFCTTRGRAVLVTTDGAHVDCDQDPVSLNGVVLAINAGQPEEISPSPATRKLLQQQREQQRIQTIETELAAIQDSVRRLRDAGIADPVIRDQLMNIAPDKETSNSAGMSTSTDTRFSSVRSWVRNLRDWAGVFVLALGAALALLAVAWAWGVASSPTIPSVSLSLPAVPTLAEIPPIIAATGAAVGVSILIFGFLLAIRP